MELGNHFCTRPLFLLLNVQYTIWKYYFYMITHQWMVYLPRFFIVISNIKFKQYLRFCSLFLLLVVDASLSLSSFSFELSNYITNYFSLSSYKPCSLSTQGYELLWKAKLARVFVFGKIRYYNITICWRCHMSYGESCRVKGEWSVLYLNRLYHIHHLNFKFHLF